MSRGLGHAVVVVVALTRGRIASSVVVGRHECTAIGYMRLEAQGLAFNATTSTTSYGHNSSIAECAASQGEGSAFGRARVGLAAQCTARELRPCGRGQPTLI